MSYYANGYAEFPDPDGMLFEKLQELQENLECCRLDLSHWNHHTIFSFDGNYHEEEIQQFLEILSKHSTQRIEIEFSGEDQVKWKFVIENGEIEEFPCNEIYTKEDLDLLPEKDIVEYLKSKGYICKRTSDNKKTDP